MLDPIGGSIVTISGNRYIQTQTFDMGTFGIFTSASPVFSDTSFVDVIECQPRIFTPSGNLFEFNKTNILYNINNGQNADVKVRIFNLAGRLKESFHMKTQLEREIKILFGMDGMVTDQ